MKFHLLNVFTNGQSGSGNQLAVVLPEKQICDEAMLSITRDFNFSETVFIYDSKNLRIFTPTGELAFAGHPTIGATWLIGKITNQRSFSVQVPKGNISVAANDAGTSVVFPGTSSFKTFSGNLSAYLQLFGANLSDLTTESLKVMNVGPTFLMIPLKNKAALDNLFLPARTPQRTYFFFEESASKFYVRMFGSGEDPGTGSAACALAAYHRDVLNRESGDVTISQGTQLGRPCEIHISWDKKEIKLAGSVTQWATGEL